MSTPIKPAAPWTGLHAPLWLGLFAGRSTVHLDPYVLWALHTQFRAFRGSGQELPAEIDFIVGLHQPYDPAMAWPARPTGARAWVPDAFDAPLPGGKRRARHISLRLPSIGVAWGQLERDVFNLHTQVAEVQRLQIGFPRPVSDLRRPEPNRACHPLGWASKAPRPKLLLGVMEDVCPFGHPAFRDAHGGTRVLALWDQSGSRWAKAPWQLPRAQGYGAELLQGPMNALMAEHTVGDQVQEDQLYDDPRVWMRPLRVRATHGAAVMALLAGRRARLPTAVGEPAARVPHKAHPVERAGIVAVQLPREQVPVAAGRWLAVRALDGLRYLAEASRSLAPSGRRPLPMVVNLSYGGVAGAHDGSNLLECAIDELCATHRELAVVLAAGNAHGTRRQADSMDPTGFADSGAHAQHHLKPGAKAHLSLLIPPEKAFETYLELWFEVLDPASPPQPFLLGNEIHLVVTPPVGAALSVDTCPGLAFDRADGASTRSGVFLLPRVSQSLGHSMALLVVAGTELRAGQVSAPAGVWQISVENTGSRALCLNAWVERDLLAKGPRHAQSARLVPNADGSPDCCSDANTLNNVGTGSSVLLAGALTGQAERPTGTALSVSPYSAEARDASSGPAFSAVADANRVLPGIRVGGSQGGMVVRMNGTSMAAPQAARWLANEMGSGRRLDDIRAALASSPCGDARQGRQEV